MTRAACQMIDGMPKIDSKTANFETKTKRKTREAPQIWNRQFLMPQMIVADAQPQIFGFAQQKLAAKNQVPRQVIEPIIAFRGRRRFAKKTRVRIQIWVVI